MPTAVGRLANHSRHGYNPPSDFARLIGRCRALRGAPEQGRGRVKFNLIDKIDLLTDDRIVASKFVSLAEEYLADHFPTFPVLPGVMMLEAATQAAGWVLHRRTGFAKSMAVLKEARNVRYGNFVAPGNFLRVDAELAKSTDAGGTFKVTGSVVDSAGRASDNPAITGRIEVALFNLGEKQPELAELDGRLREHNRLRWKLLELSVPKPVTLSVPV